MTGYAIFVTCMWVMWIIENGYKARKISQYEEVTVTQAKRIRHLESVINANEQLELNMDEACIVLQCSDPHEDLEGTRGPNGDLEP